MQAQLQAQAKHLPGHKVMASPAQLEFAQHKSLQDAMYRRLRKEQQTRLLQADAMSKSSQLWQ